MALPVVEPMTLTRIAVPFDHPDFVYELKHDGFRSLAYISEGRCDLISRRKNRYKSFESLHRAIAKLKATEAILDGEIACLDGDGRSQFNQLLHRRGEPVFYAFDLLWLDGRDLRSLPLIERKKCLRRVVFLHNFGTNNTFLGSNAGNLSMTGGNNTANGANALRNNASGNYNTALGADALYSNANGGANTAIGYHALYTNCGTSVPCDSEGPGSYNTAVGNSALATNLTGAGNTAVGGAALAWNWRGDANTAMGREWCT